MGYFTVVYLKFEGIEKMVLDTSQTYAMIKLEAVDIRWNMGNSGELSFIGYLSVFYPECGPVPPEMHPCILDQFANPPLDQFAWQDFILRSTNMMGHTCEKLGVS